MTKRRVVVTGLGLITLLTILLDQRQTINLRLGRTKGLAKHALRLLLNILDILS